MKSSHLWIICYLITRLSQTSIITPTPECFNFALAPLIGLFSITFRKYVSLKNVSSNHLTGKDMIASKIEVALNEKQNVIKT